jgi:hypothetical protein
VEIDIDLPVVYDVFKFPVPGDAEIIPGEIPAALPVEQGTAGGKRQV